MPAKAIDALRRLAMDHPKDFDTRIDLAELLIGDKQDDEAYRVLQEALALRPDSPEALRMSAQVCYNRNNFEEARDKLETAAKNGSSDPTADMLLSHVYFRLGDKHRAEAFYQLAVSRNSDLSDRSYSSLVRPAGPQRQLRVEPAEERSRPDYEGSPTGLSFDDVGGMEEVKEQLRMNIILPLKKPDLFRTYGKRVGGGILMYGPPGCGKTYISKALAGELDATFYLVGIHEILDSFLGRSEKNMHSLFETARRNAPAVVFLDEIDALGQKRGEDSWGRALRGTVDTLLTEMDSLGGFAKPILVIGATNTPWAVDLALRRPGRFDRVIFVPPPDESARQQILRLHLQDKPTENVDVAKIASKIAGFSGADIQSLVDRTVEEAIKKTMRSGQTEPITTNGLLDSTKKMRPSTTEWLATATDYVRYSNQGGFYDQIKDYLDKTK
ncbi:MAG TPA: AAA family ATPase [Candidatus Dormibacteraeota bacterium]|jgi:AAA+ superfamily predicted ATPase|nr:AAA family ATPase [Candidatus Dormibacteraeota bacterium]